MNDKQTTNDAATAERLFTCDYCGKKRPAAEMKTATIYRNGWQVAGTYCAEDHCADYAQMSAEG